MLGNKNLEVSLFCIFSHLFLSQLPQDLINPTHAELNTICHLLALLGARPILHVSRIRVNEIDTVILRFVKLCIVIQFK